MSKVRTASSKAIGVMRLRSGLLRDMPFITMPIQKYIASIQMPMFAIAGSLNNEIISALLRMMTAKMPYKMIDIALPIRKLRGRVVYAPPQAYLPIGVPKISAN